MTLKKQFITLIAFIISIPILCVSFISAYHYFRSADRYLMRGYEKIRKFDDLPLNSRDKEKLYESLKLLPPDVQTAVFAEDFKLLTTNFSDFEYFKSGKIPATIDEFWDFVSASSNVWFYQVTTLPLQDTELFIVSRIPREREVNRKKGNNFVQPLIFLLFVLVGIAVIAIITISMNITKSINIIQKNMQNIADGNLNNEIETIDKKANEITSITTNLEKMRRALIDAQNRRNKFIMGMSHDLRTPVAIIKGYTEAIADGMVSDGEEMEKTLSLINAKTSQLHSMIDTLINFVKLESNDWRENLVDESIVKLIKDFAKEAETTCAVFKRYIKTEINFSEDIKVPLDKQLVNRALENLLSNAIRYTKENDTITVRANVEEKGGKKNVILQIEDTGCGIDEGDLENIFELFYRGTNSRREEGMGIGLSVVKSIIDTHGWEIGVESKKDEGTTFSIKVPV